ncbi:aspartyl protease family protein At5g10770-like [Lolium rigidum]|uniref:aspartyl protease family protein At5g10770-like n=1 Tax=Lolium rigidum TaxID=89674 RepID=UPI001F5D3B49|nr:aspartyl protease family protein At5g10770-like [Lolium rigidum]
MAYVAQLLLLVLCTLTYHSLGAADATGSLKAEAVCAEPQVTSSSSGRITVPLNHRYGPCSPMPSTNEPTMAEQLRADQLRAEYVRRKVLGLGDEPKQSELTVPTTLGSALDSRLYVITVDIGTPAVTQHMIIDTGSDVSWVQCNPCPEPSCHAPNGTLFDPLQSSTYVPFNCTSATCLQLDGNNVGCSSSQECQFYVGYGDGANTTGTYGADTLVLTDSETVSGFQFGCSHEADGFTDQTDGLMGLGGDVQSLVSQTAATYGKAFSYCLPATSSTSGFLTLGAPNDTSDFVTTPMLRVKDYLTFYNVLLQDIQVDGNLLGISPSVFAAGSLMDSGTRITTLPLEAYSALSSAFKASMTQYAEAPPWGYFETCFDFAGVEQDDLTIPPVALVFDGGAIVDLDRSAIIDVASSCLAFFPTNETDGSVIGCVQQRTFEVLHDVGQSVFGFRKGAC